MDFDVIIVGSGFGGAVTACRLAEAGKRVLVLERGRRWKSPRLMEEGEAGATAFPRHVGDPWIWNHKKPEKHNGWLELRAFPHMSVVQGAGVGGGSLVYANVSVKAPDHSFDGGWPSEITAQSLESHYRAVGEMLKVSTLPPEQWNARTRLMQEAATKLGHGDRFRLVELAVQFDKDLALDPENPPDRNGIGLVENEHGVKQGTCHHCGECDVGCDANARNTLDTNYLPRAESHGAEIRPLHLVTRLEPWQSGYKVSFDRLENGRRIPGSHTAGRVILAAGSLGSTEILLRARDLHKTLPNVSGFLGRNWTSNGDFLTPAIYPTRLVSPGFGPTITSAIDFHDRSYEDQAFWIQDGGFPDLMASHLGKLSKEAAKDLAVGFLVSSLKLLVQKMNPGNHVMPWFAQGVDAGDGVLSLKRYCWFFGKKDRLHLAWDIARSRPTIQAIADMHQELSKATGGVAIESPGWTVAQDLITPHPLGGCNMGTSKENGVVDHRGEVFDHRNLYVADGSIFPRPIGVNPSRTIAALAERIAAIMIEEDQ